jgi:thioredoxin:protein disulfide reductase
MNDSVRVPSMKNAVLALLLASVGLAGIASAKPWWMRGSEATETDFLPPNVAFRAASRIDGTNVKVRWVIADGYYLYKHKIEIAAESPDLTVGVPDLPAGSMKTDQFMGTQEIYTQQVEVTAPYTRSDAGAHPMQIKVTYQGCAEAGLCYPPITRVLFPGIPATQVAAPSTPYRWERIAMIGGVLAFFLAGLVLRRGRKLDLPAT